MADRSCERESEILDLLGAGIAREAWTPELRAHAAACASCCELVDVAGALLEDRRALVHAARVPQSGAMWFRMTVRERQDAARTAARAGWTVQALLVALAFVIAFALVGSRIVSFGLEPIIESARVLAVGVSIPLIGIATLLILAPVAVYFAVTEE